MDSIAKDNERSKAKKKRSNYIKWADNDRYRIGKYVSQNGIAAVVRCFKKDFPNLNESTARGFKKRVEDDLKLAARTGINPLQAIPWYTETTGRPPVLGSLDKQVQSYLHSVSDRGGAICRWVAVSVAKSLIRRYPKVVGQVEVTETWAQSLLKHMGFVRRAKTPAKVEVPDGARKEIEYQFLHQVVSLIERHNIPDELVINFDQTPTKLVPVGRMTMAKRNSTDLVLAGAADKRSITATFAVTLSGKFLPMQLIYGGKSNQSLPKYKFPASFSLSVNPTHYSNREESIKFLNKIILPYVIKTREQLSLPTDQKALFIFGVFIGQMLLSTNM